MLVGSVSGESTTERVNVPRPVVIGHRGSSAYAPENTLLSYETAWKMKADMVELDVHSTADGGLVCIHDKDVSRTTNGKGLVAELTLKELRSLDAGKGQKVPLLSEVLDMARGKFGVDIEIKVPDVEKTILKLVKERRMLGSIIFSSFIHTTLIVIRGLTSEAITAVLYEESMDDPVTYARDLKANAISPLFLILEPAIVRAARNAGLRVYPWTVNDGDIMAEFLNMGVDGLITNYPDVGVRAVEDYLANRTKGEH
jgi:glycerophosphoryl diester phosphodiesterase